MNVQMDGWMNVGGDTAEYFFFFSNNITLRWLPSKIRRLKETFTLFLI